jgi:hypothetical protein
MTAGRGNHRTRTTNAPGSSPEPAPDNISEQSLMHRVPHPDDDGGDRYVGSESTSKPPETQHCTISPRQVDTRCYELACCTTYFSW